MKLTVDLGPNSYPIHIENGILAKTGELVSEVFSGRKIMIVSDDNVFPPVSYTHLTLPTN